MALHFIDISSYQSGLDINAVKGQIDGVIVKATEGTGYVSPACDRHFQAAGAAGLLRGFYHFASTGGATAEAEYFVNNTRSYFGQGVPVLDWEGNQSVSWVNEFVARVHALTGVWCWVYANPWRFNQGGVDGNCMRWVASYPQVTSPSFGTAEGWDAPAAQGGVGAWQFCSDGRLNGFGGNLDFDLFYGTADQWRAYYGQNAGVSAPVTTPGNGGGSSQGTSDRVPVHYSLRLKNGAWLDEVTDFGAGDNGFAGYPNHQHDLLCARVDRGELKYQVHTVEDGWLGYVTRGDRNDTVNGCAGIPGHTIDGVRMYYTTPGGETLKQAWYRSQTTARAGWLGVVCDDGTSYGGDDYAGIYGEPLDRLQVCVTGRNPY